MSSRDHPGGRYTDVAREVAEGRLTGADAMRVRAFRLILRSARELQYRMDRLLEADGLTTQQAALLTAVRNSATPPSLTEVAGTLRTSHQNIRQLVNALVRKGFLRIEADQEDGRCRRLVSTRKCEAYWRARNPDDYRVLEGWFGGLGADEIKVLEGLLDRLARSFATPR